VNVNKKAVSADVEQPHERAYRVWPIVALKLPSGWSSRLTTRIVGVDLRVHSLLSHNVLLLTLPMFVSPTVNQAGTDSMFKVYSAIIKRNNI
jgi:hypothetical protein